MWLVSARHMLYKYLQVANQIYNIQLMEDQKKLFVEEMSKMNAEEQHSYLAKQQTEILQTVFKNQQEMQLRAQQSAMQAQYAAPFSQPPNVLPPAAPQISTPRPSMQVGY